MNTKSRILFVCVHNSCRSQMAEGFARFFGRECVEAYSAGSEPSGKINPDAIAVMVEAGIDISKQSSKGFRDLPKEDFDYVVTMGCHDVCPFLPARRHVEWDIDDPTGKSMYFFRQVRDKIREKVRILIRNILEEERRLEKTV